MKKFLSIVAISALMATGVYAQEKSGAFVGVNAGVNIFNISAKIPAGQEGPSAKDATTFNVGIKAGWSQFFTQMFGVRGYLSYDFNGTNKDAMSKGNNLSFHNIAINADFLANFINTESFSAGVFAGLGLAYGIASNSDKNTRDAIKNSTDYNGFNIPINVGISTTFAQRHRVELGAKITTLGAQYKGKGDMAGTTIKLNPYVITLGYSFIF